MIARLLPLALGLAPALPTAAMQLTLTATNATCSYANGSIDVTVTGGVAPYTFSWSDGPTTADRTGLLPGIYTLTVTDALADEVTEQVEIISTGYDIVLYQPYPFCGAGGQLFPLLPFEVPPGANAPWYVNGEPMELAPNSPDMYVFYPSTGVYTLPFADGNGCQGFISGQLGPQITEWPELTVTDVDPSCADIGMGAIHVASSGPAPEVGEGGWVFLNLLYPDGTPTTMVSGVDNVTLEGHFEDVPPGDYLLHWWMGVTMDWLDPGICDWDTIPVTVPDLGSICGGLVGTSWYDVDADCVQDPEEVGIPLSPLLIEPGGEVVMTGSYGTFHFPLLNGDYTLAQMDPALVPICPAAQPVPFTVASGPAEVQLANGSTQPLDLRASISTGPARPGFEMSAYTSIRNLGPQLSGPITVTITLDPLLTGVNAVPTPTTVAGNVLTWELPGLISFAHTSITVQATVPVGTPLGTVLGQSVTVTNTLPDADPSNNSATVNTTVTGSTDPNDKTAFTSSGTSATEYILGTDEWIDYRIRFQNTGTDTAFNIIVTDTLPAELDLLTYEQGPASHAFEVEFRPGRIVEWRFPNVLLPDSNTNEPRSHGQVSFRIRPHAPLLPGTTIANRADIVFDFNGAIRTNDAVLTAATSTGIAAIDERCRAVVSGDRLTVYAEGSSVPVSGLQLLAMDGRLVAGTGPFTLDRNGHSLDLAGLPSGCYAVWLSTADGGRWQQRFVR